MPTDRNRLEHILDAAREAISFAQNRSRADLELDRQLYHTLVRLVEITGEAANRVSDAVKGNNPQIPWHLMAATRNRLIHGYFEVDLDVLWRIVTEHLPRLVVQIESLIAQLDAPN